MDISTPRTSRSLLALAALALVLLGAALSAVTWRNLVDQRRLIDQHVLFASRTILRGVESNLMRIMPMLGRMQPEVARERLEEVFREIADTGDLIFLGVYDAQGRLVLSSAPKEAKDMLDAPLDQLALSDLAVTGEWFGTLPMGGTTILGYAALMRPGMAQFCPCDATPEQGEQGESGQPQTPPAPPLAEPPARQAQPERSDRPGMPGRGHRGPPSRQAPAVHAPTLYFLVGMDLEQHYAQYTNFRNAALMQTGFVLGTAALLWVTLLAYLRRREQGRRLTRLESFHSKLLDALPEGLLTVDAAGMVSAVNPAAKAILGVGGAGGVEGAGLVGRPASELPLGQNLSDGSDGRDPEAFSWQQVEHGGRCLETLAVPLDGETMILVRDRTKLRSLEHDLEQTRHLAAVGRLAAGVAHEIRNPLSALRGFAQFFAAKLKGKDPEQSYAETMVQEADRLGRVVTDLLYLARPRPMEPQAVDLATLAGELSRLLRFDMERAKASLDLNLQSPSVLADADGLKQALINLILNSLAALPEDGGVITLSSFEHDGSISVSLSDTGRGMSEEERARALEPFFTTRKEGSGLGLAIVHKIIRDHRGELDIASTPGRGTTVTLRFSGAAPR
ncbi:two-component system sensor histidine kinase NtrB [Fundidesulfovibrio putealis]|uniref:two-component system sensor histidine kinase NtrB n=1 Tax=Fundidesulfovibrio putealis TaxID=270496 RepID=UPI00040D743F|nr:ATP-binding protein [Fundidesulfovibrio putealis]